MFYAIRQKSTGYFLPQTNRKGKTWLEPKKNCIPRLFSNKQAASCALGRWLKGRSKWVDMSGGTRYNDWKIVTEPMLRRIKEDMEIVRVGIHIIWE